MNKNINNKGMTLVELLITFSLLMVVVVGMFNLILDIKLDLDDKQIVKSYIDYSSYYAHNVNLNLIKNKPYMIFIKESSTSAVCMTNKGENCDTNINKFEYYCNSEKPSDCRSVKNCAAVQNSSTPYDQKFCIDSSSETFSKMCGRIYPCAIAVYNSSGDLPIKYMAIAINVPNSSGEESSSSAPEEPTPGGEETTTTTTEKPLNKSEYGLGVNYYFYRGNRAKGIYEPVPNQEYIFTSSVTPSISFGFGGEDDDSDEDSTSSNAFVIDFPLYKTGGKTNYGFKIVYPFIKQQ